MSQKSIVEKYLKVIAESLYNNQAAVMVGAGFSKNADYGLARVPKTMST